jgi:hypothetical protein
VHRGAADIVVAQGNHFVSLPSNGQPDPAFQLEVLHLPWRSCQQLQRKVVQAGQAYEQNPDLRPSKNHHGKADYRRHLAGRLLPAILLRQPTEEELLKGERQGFLTRDEWLHDHLEALRDTALCPDLLDTLLDGSNDELIDPEEHRAAAELGRQFLELERERDAALLLAEQNEKKAQRIATDRNGARRRPETIPLKADIARVGRRTISAVKRRLKRAAKSAFGR